MAAYQAGKRLMKDIQRAQEKIMIDQGIWYCVKEERMNQGYALVEGPENTPYEACLLLFSFSFPDDYPFSPPKVKFMTSDGRTRFHPNLYVDGKVCLSILGTYSGPTWSGTQSLSTVLLSILALLDNNPLSHEPAFEKGTLLDPKHKQYADAVEHNMVQLMIHSIDRFERIQENHEWFPFEDVVKERLPVLKEKLRKKVLAKAELPETMWSSLSYGMGFRSFWKTFAREVDWISLKLNDCAK